MSRASLDALTRALEAAGAHLTVELPGEAPLAIGRRPGAARVVFHDAAAVDALRRRDGLAVAEAYLDGRIDVEGDFLEAVKLTEVIPPDPTWRDRAAAAARLLRGGRRLRRESVAFHYDRPADFFLPWFERWRSYSHGFYASPDDPPERAQARKLQFALDALGAKPGQRIFEMGCGWGSFVEYAGLQGVQVHGITLSAEQHRFVSRLIEERGLPCKVELADFADFRPRERYDGAVFSGTFEHFGDYRRAAAFLAAHLEPGARLYADFCSERRGHRVGAFLARHVWPGSARYVNVPELLRALIEAGFNVHELADDTLSYACTVRDWADRLDAVAGELEAAFGRADVRAFRVYLRASQHFLASNRTQAYHLVAGRAPAGLEGERGA